MSRISGNLQVIGNISGQTITIPASSVSNGQVQALAGVDASKLQHQHQPVVGQAGTAADQTTVVHVARGATGTVVGFAAGLVGPCTGDSTVTFDLKKNGVTVLSSPVSVDSGDAAYAIVSGTVTVPALAQDDVLTVVVDATVGTGTLGTGAFASVTIREDAQ